MKVAILNSVAAQDPVTTFDQNGALWLEQPFHNQWMYYLERAPGGVKAKPELAGCHAHSGPAAKYNI